MDKPVRVLFICVHNNGRSKMAEAFLNGLAGDRFQAESAGLDPLPINPLVVEVMEEAGYDLSHTRPASVFEVFKAGRLYSYVIAVCDEAVEARCPVFPGVIQRLKWPFPDPQKLAGTREEKLARLREIRDAIKAAIGAWIDTLKHPSSAG